MTKSDRECEMEGPMTRKLLMTAAVAAAIALTPPIGAGTAEAHGGGFGAAVFTVAVFTAATLTAAVISVGTVVSLRTTTDMEPAT
jgi:hypothetical protein